MPFKLSVHGSGCKLHRARRMDSKEQSLDTCWEQTTPVYNARVDTPAAATGNSDELCTKPPSLSCRDCRSDRSRSRGRLRRMPGRRGLACSRCSTWCSRMEDATATPSSQLANERMCATLPPRISWHDYEHVCPQQIQTVWSGQKEAVKQHHDNLLGTLSGYCSIWGRQLMSGTASASRLWRSHLPGTRS
jgi:hypothetical protein